jgi:hypothetical protein
MPTRLPAIAYASLVGRARRAHLPLVAAALVVALLATPALAARRGAATTGPFLTLLFSRTEVTGAGPLNALNKCIAEDDNGVARLDTVVAPALAALGLHPTGSIQIASTADSSFACTHSGLTLRTSWSLARLLASQDGWSFVSHSASYPGSELAWTVRGFAAPYAETCATEQALEAQGLPGAAGLFAWPHNYIYAPAVPDVETCFDFNRLYTPTGITDQATATAPPYAEPAKEIKGGPCNDPTAPCYSYSFPLAQGRYSLPSQLSALIASVKANQWMTLQGYVFVTGSRPGYWDCSSADPAEHWTWDTERYCWNDYLAIVSSLPAGVTVTDPASVAAAWGRQVSQPTGPLVSLALNPAQADVLAGQGQLYEAEAYNASGQDIGEVTGATTFSITGTGVCNANLCTADDPGDYTVTARDGAATTTATLTVRAVCNDGTAACSPPPARTQARGVAAVRLRRGR